VLTDSHTTGLERLLPWARVLRRTALERYQHVLPVPPSLPALSTAEPPHRLDAKHLPSKSLPRESAAHVVGRESEATPRVPKLLGRVARTEGGWRVWLRQPRRLLALDAPGSGETALRGLQRM
jgi:hypothetical protein